jgi:hypothetical protein
VRKRLSVAAAGVAVLFLAPLGLGGHATSQAMTCTPDEPISTACHAGFGVVGAVCNGKLPKAPGATTMATIGWPIQCPPLG